jgi:signal transduction histidine kinase
MGADEAKYAVEESVVAGTALREVADARALGHDLRTPLAVINGYAELLRSEVLSPEQRARACDLILQKCEELNVVIRRLLEPYEADPKTQVAIEQTA